MCVTCCKLCSCCRSLSICVWMLCSRLWCCVSSCLASLSALSPSSKRSDASCTTDTQWSWWRSHRRTLAHHTCVCDLPYWSSPPPLLVSWVAVQTCWVCLSLSPAPVSFSPDCLSLSGAIPPSVSALQLEASARPAPEHTFTHTYFKSDRLLLYSAFKDSNICQIYITSRDKFVWIVKFIVQ